MIIRFPISWHGGRDLGTGKSSEDRDSRNVCTTGYAYVENVTEFGEEDVASSS